MIEVRLPHLSDSVTAAKVAAWLKREGDTVIAGEPIVEVETDKTNVEIEAPGGGVLQRIHIGAGTDGVPVGAVLAVIAEAGAAVGVDAVAAPAPRREIEPATAAVSAAAAVSDAPAGKILATPLAARMARLAGLDLAEIPSNTDGARISKADVEAALGRSRGGSVAAVEAASAPAVEPAPVSAIGAGRGGYEDRPLSPMRRVTAARLQQAKQTVPHFYLEVDCHVDALMDLRAQIHASGAGATVTVTDFVVLAAALALKRVPETNSSWVDSAVRVYDRVDIAVAVSTPKGLITPIVRDVDRKTLGAVSRELKALAARARDGQLKPEEYTGGTFTISNLGMFGVSRITPIVNPPQSAILGVGAIEERPIVKGGQLAAGRVMSCTLAADHRAIDGAVGATFLSELRRLLETPMAILLQAV